MGIRNSTALRIALGLAIATAGVAGVAAAAPGGDRNRDRIPDRWERANHLSLKVNQAKRDQDKDGLNNLSEFRSGTNPRDVDTDDDGVKDALEDRDGDGMCNRDEQKAGTRQNHVDTDEVSGSVVSFDATSGALVLQPASGDPVTVTVTDTTRFEGGDATALVAGATVDEVKFTADDKGVNTAVKIEFDGEGDHPGGGGSGSGKDGGAHA